jgi:LmbE family N-acetylglucosaminyl deacetylase
LVDQKVIVIVYAHPDDGVITAGGSLAKWVEEGHKIFVISATSGGLGTKDQQMTGEKLAKIREKELTNAMEIIGGNPPIFLRFKDGFLSDHVIELKQQLVYWFRKLKPNRIITFDPWRTYEIHPDHRIIGQIASEAAVFACFPLLYPEHLQKGLEPHQPDELWYMIIMEHKPNRLIDISRTLDKKIDAVLCHQASIELLADMFIPGVDPTKLTAEQKTQLKEGADSFLRMVSQAFGTLSEGKIEIAEAFYALKVGPGHFYNFQEMIQEIIGMDPDPPIIM